MAIIENGFLRGRIGDLVNRKVGNKNVVQTKASGKIRQTEWTQAAAADFGTASKAGALIRRAFARTHLKMHDGNMHNRLVKTIQRVLRANGTFDAGSLQIKNGNIKRLIDFQFNEHCHLYDYVYLDLQVSYEEAGIIHVHLPAFSKQNNLFRPKWCSDIVLRFEAVGFKYASKYAESISIEEIKLSLYDGKAEEERHLTFEGNDNEFDSILLALSVQYLKQQGSYTLLLNNEHLSPAGIIAACNPG